MLDLKNRKTRKKAKFINSGIVHVDVIIPNENDKKCLTEDEKKTLKRASLVADGAGMHGYVSDPFKGKSQNPYYNEMIEKLSKECYRREENRNGHS
tara:strand:+ start:5255 stop:5542 length:288 start_codon:yes stop_codon:yes gene_type:complete